MTEHVTVADLAAWRDSDDLLRALGAVRDEQRNELLEAVQALLGHEDPDVRQEALRWLAVRWRALSVRGEVERFLAKSENEELRTTAVYALASLSTEPTRAWDTELLVGMVRDITEDGEIRRAAYEALCILYKRSQLPPINKGFDVDREADWRWLETLLKQNQPHPERPI